jgi:hypothetical protein
MMIGSDKVQRIANAVNDGKSITRSKIGRQGSAAEKKITGSVHLRISVQSQPSGKEL